MVLNIEPVAETADVGGIAPCEVVDAGVNGRNCLLGGCVGVKAKGFGEASVPPNELENGFDTGCVEKGDCCVG
jgi:hypothetical protein